MRGLRLTNPSGYLLGFYGCNLRWANKKAVQKVKGKVLKGLGLIFRVRVDVMGCIISIQRRNICQLHYVLIKNLHVAQRLDANTKRLSRLLIRQPSVMSVDMLGGDIERLPIHGARGLVPSHLAAFISLSEQACNTFWNMLAKVHGGCCDADRMHGEPILRRIDFSVKVAWFDAIIGRFPTVNRQLVASQARSGNFPVQTSDEALPNQIVLNFVRPTPDAISNKKPQSFSPNTKTQLLTRFIELKQGVAA